MKTTMTTTATLRLASTALAAAALLALSGCQAVGSLAAAGSMLVEVEVYKGPLGKSRTVQFGELAAVFDEADVLLGRFIVDGRAVADGLPIGTDRQQLVTAIARAIDIRSLVQRAFSDDEGNRDKGLTSLNLAAKIRLQKPPATAKEVSDADAVLATATVAATRIATVLKIEAFYWAESQIGGLPANARMRSLLVGYINLASELANQIASRADTLDKQLDGVSGSQLALSDHLKDAGPTEFLHLYEWYDATLPDQQSWGPNRLTPQDRARLARRLFSDHFWTRINQVHASGQGEVRMALIKDDIGNWNLKSFDSDPEKLLDAYRNLSLAGLEAGIRTARTLASGGGTAGLDLASQFARGRLGSTDTAMASSARIDALRARATADLESLKAMIDNEAPSLRDKEAAALDELGKKQSLATARASAYKLATDGRVEVERQVQSARLLNVSVPVLNKLEADLDESFKAEEARRIDFGKAQDDERLAQTSFDAAQKKHRDFVRSVFADAKRAIEIHRRVIDGLKEIRTTPSVGLPVSK